MIDTSAILAWLKGERPGIGSLPAWRRIRCGAADAFQRYGKGQGHPSQLNMGDPTRRIAQALTSPQSRALLRDLKGS